MEHRLGVGGMIMNTIPWPVVASVAVFGVAIGATLNLIIYRVPQQESIVGFSVRCPSCPGAISRWYNVPVVGWLMMGQHCDECAGRVGRRYAAMQVGTAALFVALVLRFGVTPELPAFLYLATVGVAAAALDLDGREIPDTMILPAYIVSLLLLMPAGAADTNWWAAGRALIGMIALGSIYCALVIAYPAGMGLSDIKLAGLAGLALGWLSWTALLVGAAGSLLLAGLADTSRGRHRLRVSAFGTCMVAAAGLAVFIANPMGGWYGSLVAA
jgi:leader peptidase (prepilin peptidase) / N-methyltransferase